jgi:hypothetical protein
MPAEAMELVSPGLMVLGLALQLMVGGSYALTVNVDEQSAVWPGLIPSLPGLPSFTSAFTVYVPGDSDAVALESSDAEAPATFSPGTPDQE